MSMIIKNRSASFEFALGESFQAGVCLEGWEVKSLREGKVNIKESYVYVRDGEMFVSGLRIDPLAQASTHIDANPLRIRKLLLNKSEINKIIGRINMKGETCVALNMYWNNGKVKMDIAMAKGKNNHDKRESLKQKAQVMDQNRKLKIR
ncbi:SsrA-binding protein SmpB [Vibrio splendidus]|nr:SsrA-binding protein SmpB [Vibrio splendidus]MCC4881458.1 SsrA-binding protein SmpB [Vibrio splendidus]